VSSARTRVAPRARGSRRHPRCLRSIRGAGSSGACPFGRRARPGVLAGRSRMLEGTDADEGDRPGRPDQAVRPLRRLPTK
jgi:hypothetical protein